MKKKERRLYVAEMLCLYAFSTSAYTEQELKNGNIR